MPRVGDPPPADPSHMGPRDGPAPSRDDGSEPEGSEPGCLCLGWLDV